MSWLLDTPISTGDLSSQEITEVRIVKQVHESGEVKSIRLYLEYGYTDAGAWVRLPTPDDAPVVVVLDGQDYIDYVVAEMAVYGATKNSLYNKLSAIGALGAGSIV